MVCKGCNNNCQCSTTKCGDNCACNKECNCVCKNGPKDQCCSNKN
ncbi:metallothionein-2 [Musca domestica]|uniref:Metallothionein-2 n=1 Tax=Musca domestica TaxID=7370 RepID=A0A9J7I012_MUSDO|nr:metallothionein-2 [Musca domestica]